jgi:hypothetical protein
MPNPNPDLARAVLLLTGTANSPGIDWAMLDQQRLKLACLGEDKGKMSSLLESLSREEAEALDGIVNMLDWLTDAAADTGLLVRETETQKSE